MIALENTQELAAHFAQHSVTGGELAWLQTSRDAALSHYQQVGLPDVKDEEWRYTNLRQLKGTPLRAVSTAEALQPAVLSNLELPATAQARLVFVDGVYARELSTPSAAGHDLAQYLMPMSQAVHDYADVLQTHLGTTLPKLSEQHGFTALNSAFFHDGYALVLPRGTVISEPIEILFVAGQHAQALMSHSRNLVVLGAHSECTIVERYIAQPNSVYLANCVTEVVAGENTHFDHYQLQQESDEAFHVGAVYMNQAANAQISTHNVTLTGLVTRNDIVSNLQGQGAHIEMNGLVIGHGRQHIDSFTQINHLVPHTTSDEFYKTVLDDTSRAVFRGRIVVAQDAQKSNAQQTNNSLLLSATAETDAKPQLEIYADDVKCSHGATVGQLDEKSLFYLSSRGINEESARALLTFAFANEVVERVKVASVREELTQLIAGELLQGLEELV